MSDTRSINSDYEDESMKKPNPVLQDQSTEMPFIRLLFTFSGLALGYFLSFLDQTSVATVTSSIAAEFNAGARYLFGLKMLTCSISWVGASFLVAKYMTETAAVNLVQRSNWFGDGSVISLGER
jgi:hypothetical protein